MKGPVAIGGVGGSGTRVVAQMLHKAGFYMGGHLNEMYDNLWFTLLFRRPYWLNNASEKQVKKTIRLFDKAMNGKLEPGLGDKIFIYNAAFEFIRRHYIKSDDWRSLPISIYRTLIHSKKLTLSNYTNWGWKEPNTHLYLQPISEFYPDLKYIHIIRNGLDMAFSDNQIQLRNWGKRAGIEYPADKPKLPIASLDFWIWANRNAIKDGQSLLGESFFLINFENFCLHPQEEIKKLFSFLEITLEDQLMNEFIQLPSLPESSGRYKKEDISIFNSTQLKAVRELGYDINF